MLMHIEPKLNAVTGVGYCFLQSVKAPLCKSHESVPIQQDLKKAIMADENINTCSTALMLNILKNSINKKTVRRKHISFLFHFKR